MQEINKKKLHHIMYTNLQQDIKHANIKQPDCLENAVLNTHPYPHPPHSESTVTSPTIKINYC